MQSLSTFVDCLFRRDDFDNRDVFNYSMTTTKNVTYSQKAN